MDDFLLFFLFSFTFVSLISGSPEQPQVTFSVTPERFVFDVPFNAHCKLSNFNATGKNFEVSFWMLSNVTNIKNLVKIKIGTYLIINSGKFKKSIYKQI